MKKEPAVEQSIKRLVVKVGTSTLTHNNGKINFYQMEKVVKTLSDLQNKGCEIVLVSSGAIATGIAKMGFEEKPKNIPEKQAASAVGQGILMQIYEKFFCEYGQTVAQILLTKDDLKERKRYLNARNALLTLIKWNTIPIINENDTLAVDEIKFGDNDYLAALVAGLVDADMLVLLTDLDGLFSANPKEGKDARLLKIIDDITPEIMEMAGGSNSSFGTGGMVTKLQAAQISMNYGIAMIIANGKEPWVLNDIIMGKSVGTLFTPKGSRMAGKKRWIAYNSQIQGEIQVDKGASEALINHGKSLLPAGVIAITGSFEIGSVVSLKDPEGVEIARGIVNYSSEEVALIQGHNSDEVGHILGYKDYDEIIHRDNMTIKV